MNPEKEISFNDYFTENPFGSESKESLTEEVLLAPRKEDRIPVLEDLPLADDAVIRQYWKWLSTYFVTGEKTSSSLPINAAPVILAPFLRGEHPDMDFPILFDEHSQEVKPLRQVLNEAFHSLFSESEARILYENLLRIEIMIREALSPDYDHPEFSTLITEALQLLQHLDVHGEEGETFRAQCKKFQFELSQIKATVLGFSQHTTFQLLNLQLKAKHQHNLGFTKALNKAITGLKELLLLQEEIDEYQGGGNEVNHQFDFAQDFISFDKIVRMMPPSASTGLPPVRLNRIKDCLHTLEGALSFFSKNRNRIYVSEEIASTYNLNKLFDEAKLKITTESPCKIARSYYKSEMPVFVSIIAALRLAALEIENAYQDELHAPYFETFSFLNLSPSDLMSIPAIMVVEKSTQLMHESEDFLTLLTENIPIKVLAINCLRDFEIMDDVAGDSTLRQELAALALSHRNCYIFQGATDTPQLLHQTFADGLVAPSPTLWNILLPDVVVDQNGHEYLALHTAVESRYFPRLMYNMQAGERFGSRMDITSNPQSDQPFEAFFQEIKTPGGKQIEKYYLTMADFFALNPMHMAVLEIIPPPYRNEDLLPLALYLKETPDQVMGKIPFIWVVDEKNKLQQAAIPLSWLSRCKERLDNWEFIQELGGVNSYHVQRAIEEARVQWQLEKDADIALIKEQANTEVEDIRKEEAGKAMERLVNFLLDMDQTMPLNVLQNNVIKSLENPATSAPSAVSDPEVAPDQEQEISSDAWVETFRCTSCNDCTEQLPAVFKYNADKQAYVHNPRGGTYAKLITVAEKCPAKCIHPGLPQQPDEPGMAELIKRAEALN
jgi:ferredoxin